MSASATAISSSPPSSSSLSSFVLHGDTLRCILAYFRRHAEINVLRRVSHTLEVESNKPSLWPPHLRVIQPREKNFLAQFTSDEKVKPSLCYVHQLDLRFVSSPRLKYLLHFTRLNTLRLNVRSMHNRKMYARTLVIFLQNCGATIRHLHVEIDAKYNLAQLCRHMPQLEQLDLATDYPHISPRSIRRAHSALPRLSQADLPLDSLSDGFLSESLRGLTPKVNPELKRIRLFWYPDARDGEQRFPSDTHLQKTRALLKEMEVVSRDIRRPVSLQTVVRVLHDCIHNSRIEQTTKEMELACARYPEIQVLQVSLSINLQHANCHLTISERTLVEFCAAYDKLYSVHTTQKPSLYLQFRSAPSSIERYVGRVASNRPTFPLTPESDSPTSNFISFYSLKRDLLQPLVERCQVMNIECLASRSTPGQNSRLIGRPDFDLPLIVLDPLVTVEFGDRLLPVGSEVASAATIDPASSTVSTSIFASSTSSSSSSIFGSCRRLQSIYVWSRHFSYCSDRPALRAHLAHVDKFAKALQSHLRVNMPLVMHDLLVDPLDQFEFVLHFDEKWKGLRRWIPTVSTR